MTTGDGGLELARLGKTPAEKAAALVRPFSGLVWTATEIMHWAGMQGWADLAIATAIAAPLAWGASARGWVPSALPAWIALAGGWTAAAWYLGPLAWMPAPVLTVMWIILLQAAHRAAHRHPAVIDARQWRDARARWLAVRNEWGMGGTHLLGYAETGPDRNPIGELYEVSTKSTGHRASQFLTRGHEETIAEAENLPRGRVQIRGHELAGRILISVRRRDPWAEPLLHPLACEDHEIALPETRSILDPALVGQDPETGEPLTIPLCDENGAKRVSIVASSGGGKGVLEDDLFEHVTACGDALAVHLNLSVKGHEDEESWGPACWLTAYGAHQKARAAAILKVIAAVIEWRTKNFKRGQYVPSPQHPAIIIFNDESDSALGALREDIGVVVTKGRSHGVGWVRLGQRNTREYADPKARSQDNVRCTGLVQNTNEARHAGSGAGPDMSTYGEGKPGVWKVELLGAGMSLGRTWIFHRSPAGHGAFVEQLAQERAFDQPELTGECRDYLGAPYEALLATEVFTRWAHDSGILIPEPDDDDERPQDVPPLTRQDENGTGAELAVPAAGTATAVADPDLEKIWNTPMDESTTARNAAIHARLTEAGEILAETAAAPRPPAADPADRAAYIAARWQQFDTGARVPEEVRPRLLSMLAGGTTTSAVAAAFGVKFWEARTWLDILRGGQVATVTGAGKARQWHLAPPPGDGDAQ